MRIPRILVAGLRGGSGKTLVAVGLAAAWRKKNRRVAPFKKGPDYIDAAWLSAAAGRPCRNLDLFLMGEDAILRSFGSAAGADVAVIEGNRGLYDGVDASGTYSTAELAKVLQIPVILAVDCTKSTRTVAASILGCQKMDSDVPIRGVVLNQAAGGRHESVLRKAVTDDCGLPVLGAIPRLSRDPFPERHLGLVPPQETEHVPEAIAEAAGIAARHLELDAIDAVAREAPGLPLEAKTIRAVRSAGARKV
ncbi:MAG: AAA family ATPase, partial [Planctomycetota bacterium]